MSVLLVAVVVLYVASAWLVFTKAGQPGWAVLIPFYNVYVVLKIVGRPGWWLVLAFIPIVNAIFSLIVSIDLAKSYGRGTAFGLGLWFVPFVFLPILAFGDATYVGPGSSSGGGDPAGTTLPIRDTSAGASTDESRHC